MVLLAQVTNDTSNAFFNSQPPTKHVVELKLDALRLGLVTI